MATPEVQSNLNGLNGSHRDPLASARDRVSDQVEQVRDALTDFNQKASTFIRERPALCLAAAVGVGFLVGRLVARR
jgi:ElaB/YqjD/DUF883 family membrane-anchored ribosome-binding protein